MGCYSLLRGRDILLQEGMQCNLREKAIVVHYADGETPMELDFMAVRGMDSAAISKM